MSFDPNATATADSGIFGLPFGPEEARLHLLPVPWEATTSYGEGASRGPSAIFRASHQVDLFDLDTGDSYRHGYFMHEISKEIAALNKITKAQAQRRLEFLEEGNDGTPEALKLLKEVNDASNQVNDWVYEESKSLLAQGKLVGLIGGDHSTPFGLIRAINEKFSGDFGVLHVDAHADLRPAYQGYEHSHASIMRNVIERLKLKSLVQVGIRDFSEGEFDFIKAHEGRISTYFDISVKRRLHNGDSWQKICNEIVECLPKNVHISFDIDGLTPDLCPGTGTPVPGGLSFDQATTLIATVAESGRKIVSFDLNEVAEPEEPESDWDGNVGARLLFKLCGWTMVTNGLGPSKEVRL